MVTGYNSFMDDLNCYTRFVCPGYFIDRKAAGRGTVKKYKSARKLKCLIMYA